MKGYIRFGELPPKGRSYNFVSQHFEVGVSAFHAEKLENSYIIEPVTPQEVYELRALLNKRRNLPVLYLSGREAGNGSAGEPLLKDVKVLERIPDRIPLLYRSFASWLLANPIASYNEYRRLRDAEVTEPPEVRDYSEEIPDPAGLVTYVLEDGTNTASRLHGPHHWRLVAFTAMHLVPKEESVDVPVVFLFSLLHDSKRLTDGRDRDHGKRAAEFAEELHGEWFHLADEQLDTLTYALSHHASGHTTEDLTTGVCWDADRLNLWRVGIRPDAKYLSRPASEQLIGGVRFLQNKDYDWQTIFRLYALPCDEEPVADPTAADRSDIFKAISWELRDNGEGDLITRQWRKWGWHKLADQREAEQKRKAKAPKDSRFGTEPRMPQSLTSSLESPGWQNVPESGAGRDPFAPLRDSPWTKTFGGF